MLVHADGRIPPAVTAIRVERPPTLDGRLDDEAWRDAVPATGFRRDYPSDGEPASDSTEVRVTYDDRALYVGARLHAKDVSTVSRRLSRRDAFEVQNDKFFVMLDAHHDHRTAFIFGVTPAGEREDARSSGDSKLAMDPSWDPVWDAATRIDSLGWVAEMRIPLSQLRFSAEDAHVWGIQFRRDLLSAGEAVDWAWTPGEQPGFTTKFGHLLGLDRLRRPSRLEILPHVVTKAAYTEGADPENPFDDGSVYDGSMGVDLKYGVSSDLTLDVSVNPDFGQVDADPAVVNLTNFETFFPELRPLFIEGSDIFQFGIPGHQMIYSRRIGRAPQRSALGTQPYVDQPLNTTILGAAKLSGRTQSGWSIGFLDAVTSQENARLADSPSNMLPDTPVEPLTNYAVARAKKDFLEGSSQLGFAFTGVHRDQSEDAFKFLNRASYAGGIDFIHRFKQNAYSVQGMFAFSHILGDTTAMQVAQQASSHYFQRPDQDHVIYDPQATSMTGTFGLLMVSENAGNWTFSGFGAYSSPGYEINDAGFQGVADHRVVSFSTSRRWLQPGKLFRTASVNLSAQVLDENFGGENWGRRLLSSFSGQLNNFWSLGAGAGVRFRGINDRETRGGPLIERPPGVEGNLSVSSDGRKVGSASGNLTMSRDVEGGWSVSVDPTLRIRTQGRFSLQLTPRYMRSRSDAFYVTQASDPLAAATFGNRYVFAGLDQTSLDITLRADFAINSDMTLQLYTQPLVASGDYDGFKEFAEPSSYNFIDYDGSGSSITYDATRNTYTADADGAGPGAPITFFNPDFTIRSLRTNLVFRWEYIPGSTLFVVWSQNRFTPISDPAFQAFSLLGDLFDDDMRNVLVVKMNYWLNY